MLYTRERIELMTGRGSKSFLHATNTSDKIPMLAFYNGYRRVKKRGVQLQGEGTTGNMGHDNILLTVLSLFHVCHLSSLSLSLSQFPSPDAASLACLGHGRGQLVQLRLVRVHVLARARLADVDGRLGLLKRLRGVQDVARQGAVRR